MLECSTAGALAASPWRGPVAPSRWSVGAAAGTDSGRGHRAVWPVAAGAAPGVGAVVASGEPRGPRRRPGERRGRVRAGGRGGRSGVVGLLRRVGLGVSERPEAWRSSASASSGSSERRHGRRSPSPSRREKWTLSDPPLSAPQAARGGNPEAAGRRALGWGVAQGQPTYKLLLGWGSRVHGKARQTNSLTPTHALPSLSRGPFHFL